MSRPSEIGKKTSVRNRDKPALPGNDGQWFLELVGIVPGANGSEADPQVETTQAPLVEIGPSAMSAVRSLRNQDAADRDTTTTLAPPTTIDLTPPTGAPPEADEELSETTHMGAIEGLAATTAVGTAAVTSSPEPADTEVLETVPVASPPDDSGRPPQDPPSAPTSPTVQDTWRSPTKPAPPADWTGEALSASGSSKRRSRLPLIVVVVVAVAAVVVAALWLPVLVDGRASEAAGEYRRTLLGLRSALPASQSGLEAATEPSADESDLLTVPQLMEPLEFSSAAATTAAAQPLPEPLPLMPSGPIDDLVPSRDAVAAAGSSGLDISLRVNDTVTYRVLLSGILLLPDLPIEAGPAEIEALQVTLETVEADSVAAAAALPTDPAFTTHRAQVTEAVGRFGDWSVEYLDALRRGDKALAAELVAEIEAVRPALARSLVPALATMRTEVDGAILVLNNDIAAALIALPS